MKSNNNEFLVNLFKENFKNYKEKNIVLYGIGVNTDILVKELDDYNIIGLMDEVSTGEMKYNMPILSMAEAISKNVDIIIIVARESNIPIIYRRIAMVCKENNIPVYSVSGEMLKFYEESKFNSTEYEETTQEKLQSKILNAEVISFDIFDTLIMRKVLYPRDIFRLVERKIGKNFTSKRISAEMMLNEKSMNPTIEEIYKSLSEFSYKEELDTEIENLVCREEMCEMVKFAQKNNKQVFATSDMYLPKKIIGKIFNKLNINIPQENILVSCDYKTDKSNELFLHLKEKVQTDNILHIGDNYQADIVSAKKCGIKNTFYIKSSIDMLEDSNAKHLLKYEDKLENRCIIGAFIARELNNPFLFSETDGKFKIENLYNFGYSFLGPFALRLFRWILMKSQKANLDLVLLPARDGFLFNEIYLEIKKIHEKITPMKYFYTSRFSAGLAGVKNKEDIEFISSFAFSGTFQDMIKKRFKLENEYLATCEKLTINEYIHLYEKEILENANIYRENYLRYINKLKISNVSKVGFFDFVASGTCQKMLDNILEFDIQGLYCAKLNYMESYKPNTEIKAMYGTLNTFNSQYNIMKKYLLLENIITSPDATVDYFDVNGKPIFLKDMRDNKTIENIMRIQKGMIDYSIDNFVLSNDMENLDICDSIIGLIDNTYISNINYSDLGIIIDEFSNRKDIFN